MKIYKTQAGQNYTEQKLREIWERDTNPKNRPTFDIWIKDNRLIEVIGGDTEATTETGNTDPYSDIELNYKRLLSEAQDNARIAAERIRELEGKLIAYEQENVRAKHSVVLLEKCIENMWSVAATVSTSINQIKTIADDTAKMIEVEKPQQQNETNSIISKL